MFIYFVYSRVYTHVKRFQFNISTSSEGTSWSVLKKMLNDKQ